MLFGKVKKVIEDKEAEIKLNLSNNYKDAAFRSYQEFEQLIVKLRDDGKIGDKDFNKLLSVIDDYKKSFKKYIK